MASAPSWFVRPGTAEVRAIASIENPIVRNLRITESYARISLAMRQRTGPGANWCTFASWASRQAGCTIRGEDFFDRLADRVRPGWTVQHPVRSLWRTLLRRGLLFPGTRLGRIVRAINSPFDAFERASESVGRGNLKVFEEIAYEFARFLEECPPQASVNSPAFVAFVRDLRPGSAPAGQDLLRSAFTRYQLSRTAATPELAAQMMLMANLEIGLHEQTRLQPEIQQAMEAVPDTLQSFRERLLIHIGSGLRSFARQITREIISEHMMVLRLPVGVLAMGSHLDAPVPVCYSNIEYSDLRALLDRFESDCNNCGAEDWSDLDQRMHYILHLFRAFAMEDRLFDAPFTTEQVRHMQAGRVPDGVL